MTTTRRDTPWNKGKLLGQKPPLKLKEIWAIRIRLQLDHPVRAVQVLLGHTKLESTVRYLGIEVDDALEIVPRRQRCSCTTLVATAELDGR